MTRAAKRKSLAESDAAPPLKKQQSSLKPAKKAAASKAKPKATAKATPKAKAPARAPTRSASSSPPSDPPLIIRTPSPFPPGRPAAAPTHIPVVSAGTLSPAIQAVIVTAVRDAIRPCLRLVGPMVNHTRACARFAAGEATVDEMNEGQEVVYRWIVRVARELGEPPVGINRETNEGAEGSVGEREAEASEESSGGEDSGEDGEHEEEEEEEGTRKPKKEGQKKRAPRRRSEAELLGPAPELTSGKRVRKPSGTAKELRRIMEWDWPM